MTIWKSLTESDKIGTQEPVLLKIKNLKTGSHKYESGYLFKTDDGKDVSYSLFDGDMLDPSKHTVVGHTDYPTDFKPLSELVATEASDRSVLVEILAGPKPHCESSLVTFEDGKPEFYEELSHANLNDIFNVSFEITGWTEIPE